MWGWGTGAAGQLGGGFGSPRELSREPARECKRLPLGLLMRAHVVAGANLTRDRKEAKCAQASVADASAPASRKGLT